MNETSPLVGIWNVSLISKDDLFLCDSGDAIIYSEDRCDIKMDCYDYSDEKNCLKCESLVRFMKPILCYRPLAASKTVLRPSAQYG